MDYQRTSHSKFLLMYHFIFLCKYRKHLWVSLNTRMKKILFEISENSGFAILEMEVDKNHIHILVESEPIISVLQIVRRLNQMSTIRIWEESSEHLKKHFWK